jgi:hypothetical protein
MIEPWLIKGQEAARAAVVSQSGEAAAAQLDIRPKAGGLSGTRTYLKSSKVVEIVDYEAALAHVKDNAAVKDCVAKVCKSLVKAGQKVPGVEVREEQKAI